MKNSKKKLLGILFGLIFLSFMINSVTIISSLSENNADDIVLNEDIPHQADDFIPTPLSPNQDFKWDFSNGTELGFQITLVSGDETTIITNYYNITSMPYLFNSTGQDDFSYCVQLEELYFNSSLNTLLPAANTQLINLSLVNFTIDYGGYNGHLYPAVMLPGGGSPAAYYFGQVNPFIPRDDNDPSGGFDWCALRLQYYYNYIIGPTTINTWDFDDRNIYFRNGNTGAYVNLTYDSNGIIIYGELHMYDDEDQEWSTTSIERILDTNPFDTVKWSVDVGDILYWGVNQDEMKVNISKIQNVTYYSAQFGFYYVQEVWGDFDIWDGDSWEHIDFGGMGNSIPIGSANDFFPLMRTPFQYTFAYLLPIDFEISEVADIWQAHAEHEDFNIVTYGDIWVELYNSSTGGFKRYTYNNSGIMELLHAVDIESAWDDEYTGVYLKNSTMIYSSKIWEFEIQTLGTNDFNVTLNISVIADTDLLYSAFNINPFNVSLSYGVLFIDVWVNITENELDQTHYAPINITIEFDPAQYNNIRVYWFNDTNPDITLQYWQAIPFTDYGNGIIVFTVNHTSIFAINDIPPSTSGLVAGGDDDDDGDDNGEDINAVMIIIIVIIGTVVLLSVGGFYVKKKIKTQQSPIGIKKKTRASLMPVKSKEAAVPKKKKKFYKLRTAVAPLTEAEKEDLKRTEAEVDVKKRKFICVVHKGPIIGPNYLCPHCETFYCVRCANALKEKGENCWSCEREIEL